MTVATPEFLRAIRTILVSSCLVLMTAVASATQPVTTNALDRALDTTVSGKATGTVLIARSGRVLLVRSYADSSQTGFKPTPATSYDLASIAKTFTAILALRQQDRGRFDLDRPLGRYLPELPASLRDISSRMALSHTAGLERYLDGDDLVPRTSAQTLAEISGLKHTKVRGQYYYSNLGPQLVAIALERASGQTYQALIKKQILRPIGMRNSYLHGDPILKNVDVASAYVGGEDKGSPAGWPQTWTMLGAAGIAASAEDMLKLNRAVFAGSFLKPATRAVLLSNGASTGGRASFKTPDTLDIRYGHGLFHWRDRQGRRVHFHGGGSDFGTNTGFLWRQDDDIAVIVLLNSSTSAFSRSALYSEVLEALE